VRDRRVKGVCGLYWEPAKIMTTMLVRRGSWVMAARTISRAVKVAEEDGFTVCIPTGSVYFIVGREVK